MQKGTLMEETLFDVPGGWTRRTVQLAGRRFDLRIPADPDQVLEEQFKVESRHLVEADSALSDPYWAALWSSASPLSEAVLRANWGDAEFALELGCGVGLVGLAALAVGLHVTFSDYAAPAVQVALDNARRNGLGQAQGGLRRAQGLELDWHQPIRREHEGHFAVILASDILYNRGNHGPLLSTIDRLLSPDGVCWIGDPGRYHSGDFLKVAQTRFHVEMFDQTGDSLATLRAGKFQRFVLRR